MKLLSLFTSPKTAKEISPMSDYVQIHKPAVYRAIDAFKQAIVAIKEREAEIADLEAKAAEDKLTIEALTAALNQVFPPDAGGSTGGVVG
jgi:hypothetical protein